MDNLPDVLAEANQPVKVTAKSKATKSFLRVTVKLPYRLDWKVRYACMMLEGNAKAPNTFLDFIVFAVERELANLSRRNISIPEPPAAAE